MEHEKCIAAVEGHPVLYDACLFIYSINYRIVINYSTIVVKYIQ